MSFKKKIGAYILSKKMKEVKRTIQLCNINEAKTIGILFNATELSVFEMVKTLSKDLKNKNIEVNSIGFINSKKVVDHYLYRKGFEFITKKELNWYGRPKEEQVEKFISKEFDILLDLSLVETYPIQYIVTSSKAKLKVGKFNHLHNHDLMIDIERDRSIRKEIKQQVIEEKSKKNISSASYESLVEKKADEELDLRFLIEQSLHYLAEINTKNIQLNQETSLVS